MRTVTKAGLVAVLAATVIVVPGMPAQAFDGEAAACDITVVGSDTAEYASSFIWNGINGGAVGGVVATGFNSSQPHSRVFDLSSTPDWFGRPDLGAGVVTRAGNKPLNRDGINGSGAGITSMLADVGSTETINIVRSSRQPKTSEGDSARAKGWGGLHVYKFASDGLGIATRKAGSNAPALTINDLLHIYDASQADHWTTWGQVPGYTGTDAQKAATIHAIIPQSGSGTFSFFDSALKAAKGGTSPTIDYVGPNPSAPADIVGEEHDPSLLTNDPDAIAPFSTGRIALEDSGYFVNSPKVLANTVQITPDNSLRAATVNYLVSRDLFFVVRERDVSDTTGAGLPAGCFPFLGTKNFVKSLLSGATSRLGLASVAGPPTQAAGLTYSYADLGVV